MQNTEGENIRILHLISSAGLLGAERVVLELAHFSRLAGLKAAIGVFQNSRNANRELADAARDQGHEVEMFPCRGRWDRAALRRIADYLGDHRIQVVHSHNYKSNFYARRALANHPARWVVTNHGRRAGAKLLLYHLLDARLVRRADQVVTVSERIARQLERAGVKPGRIQVVANGVRVEQFHGKEVSPSYKQSLGIKPEAMVVGSIGSLTQEKGHGDLITAVAAISKKFPEMILLLVGDGKEREKLEKMVHRLGMTDKTIFAGTRKDIPAILSILDLFVLPSLMEGLPMALLEAQAAQVPVVATSVGAIPRVIEDNVTGVLVPPRNAEAISQAMIRLLSEKESSREMARRGLERVRRCFSAEKMASKYLSLYRGLLS